MPTFQVFSSHVGKNIRAIRKINGMNQKQLSVIAGVNQSQLSKMERGHQSVSCCVICKLSEYFQVEEAYFFRKKQEPLFVCIRTSAKNEHRLQLL